MKYFSKISNITIASFLAVNVIFHLILSVIFQIMTMVIWYESAPKITKFFFIDHPIITCAFLFFFIFVYYSLTLYLFNKRYNEVFILSIFLSSGYIIGYSLSIIMSMIFYIKIAMNLLLFVILILSFLSLLSSIYNKKNSYFIKEKNFNKKIFVKITMILSCIIIFFYEIVFILLITLGYEGLKLLK